MEDLFDKDITVVNRCYDKKKREAWYKVSYVKGYWSSHIGISIKDVDIIKADGLNARILMNQEGYQTPEDFNNEINKLTVEEVDLMPVGEINSLPVKMFTEKDIGWTLQKGDYLIKGKIENFINVNELLEEHQDAMKIVNIATKDYGSEDMRHWAITGE